MSGPTQDEVSGAEAPHLPILGISREHPYFDVFHDVDRAESAAAAGGERRLFDAEGRALVASSGERLAVANDQTVGGELHRALEAAFEALLGEARAQPPAAFAGTGYLSYEELSRDIHVLLTADNPPDLVGGVLSQLQPLQPEEGVGRRICRWLRLC